MNLVANQDENLPTADEVERLIAVHEQVRHESTLDRIDRLTQTVSESDAFDEISDVVACLAEIERFRRSQRLQAESREIDSVASMPLDSEHATPLRIGRLKIREELGRGGGGIVYRAFDPTLERDVALKLPRPEILADQRLRQRFLIEAKAASRLKHPGIVAVHDTGDDAGICYIVSEYCKGPTLAGWLASREDPLSPTEAAQIALNLADAVDAAHCQGVLHRDIKPSNVLLADHPQPGRPVHPKVSDFGLAKLLEEDEDQTKTGVILGTPRYMSPEQASGSTKQIGVASDIYSLGVLLYEMLTGRPPHLGETDLITFQKITTEEPVPVRRHRPQVHRDLEAICLKCLEKKPAQRYRSAADLRDDLERYLIGKPTRARPLSPAERTIRWAKHRPALASLIALAILSVITGVVGMTLFTQSVHRSNIALEQVNADLDQAFKDATAAQKRAETSDRRTRNLLYATDMKIASDALRENDTSQVRALLDRHRPAEGQPDLRDFAWHYLERETQLRPARTFVHPAAVYRVRYSPDGKLLATACADGKARIWDVDDPNKPVLSIETGHGEVNSVRFDATTARLATTGDDASVRVWNRKTGELLLTIEDAHTDQSFDAIFTPDGSRLVTCGIDEMVRVWDTESGKLAFELHNHPGSFIEEIALSPDGKIVATAGDKGRIVVRRLAADSPILLNKQVSVSTFGVSFLPRDPIVCAMESGGKLIAWNYWTEQEVFSERVTLDDPRHLIVDEHSRALICDDRGGVAVWQFEGAQASPVTPRPLQIQEGRIWSVAGSPISDTIATAGDDGAVNIGRHTPITKQRWKPLSNAFRSHAFSRDGSTGMLCENNFVRILHLDRAPPTTTEIDFLEVIARIHGVALSPDGNCFALAKETGLSVRNTAPPHEQIFRWKYVPTNLAFSGDGRCIACFDSATESLVVVHIEAGTELMRIPDTSVSGPLASSPTETLFACARDSQILLCNPTTGSVRQWKAHRSINGIVFSSDGQQLLTWGDRELKLWSVDSPRLPREFVGHRSKIRSATISADGKTIAATDQSGITFWCVAAGQAMLQLSETARYVRFLPSRWRLIHDVEEYLQLTDLDVDAHMSLQQATPSTATLDASGAMVEESELAGKDQALDPRTDQTQEIPLVMPVSKLTVPRHTEGDHFGWHLATDGDEAIISAPMGSSPAVHLFQIRDGTWAHQQSLPIDAKFSFGTFVELRDDFALIGQRDFESKPGRNSGIAWIFERDNGKWLAPQKLVHPNLGHNERFGAKVCFCGEDICVWSDRGKLTGRVWTGGAVIYAKDDHGQWNIKQTIVPDSFAEGDGNGAYVAGNEHTFVMGFPKHDGTHRDQGALLLYRKDPKTGRWQYDTSLTAPDAAESDNLGLSVAFDGATLIAEADKVDLPGLTNTGAAYFWNRESDGSWTYQGRITSPEPMEEGLFGWPIFAGDLLLVTQNARWDEPVGAPRCVFAYRRDESRTPPWRPIAKLAVSLETDRVQFPSGIGISGHHVLVGAKSAIVDGKPFAGAVYHFDLSQFFEENDEN